MHVTIFGLGYVGTVSAAALARLGHNVTGVEIDPRKTRQLRDGVAPVSEPRLQELLDEALREDRFAVTSDAEAAVLSADVVMIAVGTPSKDAGEVELGAVEGVCEAVGKALTQGRSRLLPVMIRSTIPPTAIDLRLVPLIEDVTGSREGELFSVVANPEFLREGSAIADFFDPFATVLGVIHDEAEAMCRLLYNGLAAPIHVVGREEAFMLKYACNAFHALKIVFANEIGILCEDLGIDSGAVMQLFCEDDRLNISKAYLRPGFGFGGSCLPKDLRAIESGLGGSTRSLPLLSSIMESNRRLVSHTLELIRDHCNSEPVALIGVAFKAGTDDLRESPYAGIAMGLARAGVNVQVFDPSVFVGPSTGENARLREELLGSGILVTESLEDCLRRASIVVISHGRPDLIEALRTRNGLTLIDLTNDEQIRLSCTGGNEYLALTTGAR